MLLADGANFKNSSSGLGAVKDDPPKVTTRFKRSDSFLPSVIGCCRRSPLSRVYSIQPEKQIGHSGGLTECALSEASPSSICAPKRFASVSMAAAMGK